MKRAVVFTALSLYLLAAVVPVVHYDLWHEMSLAKEALALRHIPHADLFSYAPTVPVVVDHEWLSGLLALAAYSIPHGLFALWILVMIPAIAFFIWSLRETSEAAALLSGLVLGPMLMYSQIEPVLAQAYSVLFAMMLLFFFHLHHQGKRRWMAAWIPIFILWANMHGGVVVGFALLAAFILERVFRRESYRELMGLFAGMILLMAVNPYGWHYYRFIVQAILLPRPGGEQWDSNWIFGGRLGGGGAFAASFIFFLCFTFFRRKMSLGTLIVFTTGLLTFLAHKMIPFYGLSWVFWIGRQEFKQPPRFLHLASSIVAAGMIPVLSFMILNKRPWIITVPGSLPGYGFKMTQPIGPADYLSENRFHGNLLTSFHNGGYVSWRLYPDVKVSCDSRYEVAYPPKDAERNLALYFSEPELIEEELKRLPATDAILCPREAPLAGHLVAIHWRKTYEDDEFVLYFRPGSRMPYQDRRGERILETL